MGLFTIFTLLESITDPLSMLEGDNDGLMLKPLLNGLLSGESIFLTLLPWCAMAKKSS